MNTRPKNMASSFRMTLLFAILFGNVKYEAALETIDIDTSLTLDNSPYTFSTNLNITEKGKLTVQPGVIVQFDPGASVQVHGVLQVVGQRGQEINLSWLSGDDSCRIHLHRGSIISANYVNIHGCQLSMDEYAAPLVLQHVTVMESPGNGLQIKRMSNPVTISDSSFTNNTLSGIRVETYVGQVNIERVEASGNGETGITYIRLLPPPPLRKTMLCTPGVKMTQLSPGEAIEVTVDSTHKDARSGCSQSFKTVEGWNVLASFRSIDATRFSSNTGYNRLDIRDGNGTRGRLIRQIHLVRSRKAYTPDMSSTGGELWFRLNSQSYYYRVRATILIRSIRSGGDGMKEDIKIKSSNFTKNGHGGFFIVEARKHIAIEKVELFGNCYRQHVNRITQNCTAIIGGASTISVVQSTFDNDYFKITPDGRDVNIENCVFINNVYGLYFGLDESIGASCIAGRRIFFNLTENLFERNENGIIKNPRYRSVYIWTESLKMKNNRFISNSETAVMVSESYCSSCTATIERNVFQNNQNTLLLDGYPYKYTYITNNQFTENHGNYVLNLKDSSQRLKIFNNSFTNNIIRSITRTRYGDSAVILQECEYSTLQYNSFHNPESDLQVVVFPTRYSSWSISMDATYNYWGSSDLKSIQNGIMDQQRRYDLRLTLQILPYYIDRTMTTTGNETVSLYSRTEGSVIGGAVTEHMVLYNREYRITDDIHVYPNVTLVITAGARLMFDDYIGMIVQGQLIAEGTVKDQIVMNASVGWMGIRFSLSAQRGILRHIIFDGCGKRDVSPLVNCIVSDVGKHEMDHLLFENCHSSYSVDLYHSDPVYTPNIHNIRSNRGIFIRSLDTKISDSIFDGGEKAIGIQPETGYSAQTQAYFLQQNSLQVCFQSKDRDIFLSTFETLVFDTRKYRCSGKNVTFTTGPNNRISFQLVYVSSFYISDVIRVRENGSTTEISRRNLKTWVISSANEIVFDFGGCVSCQFSAIISSVEEESVPIMKQLPDIEIRNISATSDHNYGIYIYDNMYNSQFKPWNYLGRQVTEFRVPFYVKIVNSFLRGTYGFHMKIYGRDSSSDGPFHDVNIHIENVIIDSYYAGIDFYKYGGRYQGDMMVIVKNVEVIKGQYGMHFYQAIYSSEDVRNPKVYIQNSSFSHCSSDALVLDGDRASFEINQNKFHDNNNIFDITGREKNLTVADNLIYGNRGRINLAMLEHAYMDIPNKPTTRFYRNILENNTINNCFIDIYGVQNIQFQNNSLNNPSAGQEVCIKSYSNGDKNRLDFMKNYWGTTELSEIEKRITHFADSSRYALVNFVPYLDKPNGIPMSQVQCPFSFTTSSIGGILCSDTTLLPNETYITNGDIIVPKDMVLKVGPGTTIQFSEGSRMLILGTLLAEGTLSEPVILTSLNNWNGVYFSVNEGQTQSIMSYVKIDYRRGYWYDDREPLVTIVGKPPLMSFINLTCSHGYYPSDGVVGLNVLDGMRIADTLIQNCDGSAIRLSHLGSSMRYSIERYHDIKDETYGIPNMCDYKVKGFEVNGAMIAIFAYGDRNKYPEEMICAKTFFSTNRKILHFRTIYHSKFRSFKLEAYNGRNMTYSERFLYETFPSSNMHKTNQDTFTIRLTMRRYRNSIYAVEVYEENYKLQESPKRTFTVENGVMKNNGNGVKAVFTGSSTPDINITTSRFMNNLKSINITSENSSITISHNQFKENKRVARILTESDNGQTKIIFAYNNVTKNTGQTLIHIKDKSDAFMDRGNLCIMDNDISNNFNETNSTDTTTPMIWIDDIDGVIQGNKFANNRGSKLIWWKQRQEPSKFLKNLVRHNSGEHPHDKITIVAEGKDTSYTYNWLENPANTFEMTSVVGYPTVQATMNWWGKGVSFKDVSYTRLRSTNIDPFLPGISFEPIATSPKQILGNCDFGWQYSKGTCYYLTRGTDSFSESLTICKERGAVMVKPLKNLLDDVFERLNEKGMESPLIWTRQASQEECGVYDFNSKETKTKDCTSYFSTICYKEQESQCPNSCTYNGKCFGKTCTCDMGWERDDCSVYHCRDVNNCGRFGSCVGPNQCRCQQGWNGVGCSISYCPRFTGCLACTKQIGCGWCDKTQQCMPGRGDSPTLTTCPAWFYYNCLTTKADSKCSNEIQAMDCSGKQCNRKRNPHFTQEKCTRCVDIEKCFIDADPSIDCKVWNSTKCPNGLINIDYTKPRFDKTVMKNGVLFLDPNFTPVLRCPTKTVDILVVLNEIPLPRYKITTVVSPQSGGIAHKILSHRFSELSSGKVTIMSGIPASLNDLITYSDFNEAVEIRPIDDILIAEHETDEDLLDQLENMRNEGSRVHLINDTMFRCLGEHVDDAASFVIAIPKDLSNAMYAVGDILVGTPLGYIEKVTSIDQDSKVRIAKTELTKCTTQLYINADIITHNEYKPKLNCFSGENNLKGGALMPIYESQNVVEGSFIQGRKTKQFSAKILDKYSSDRYNFYVMTNVVSVGDDGYVETEISEISRRKRQTPTSYSRQFKQLSLNKKATFKAVNQDGHSGYFNIKVKYDDARVTLSQTMTSERPITSTLGVNLEGQFIYNLDNRITWNHKDSSLHQMSLDRKCNRVKRDVSLKIGNKLSVPAKLTLDSTLKYSAESKNSGDRLLSAAATNGVGVEVGFHKAMGKSHFSNMILDINPPELDETYMYGNETGRITVKSRLDNILTFTYPSGKKKSEQQCPGDIVGNELCEAGADHVTDFKVTFNLPIRLDRTIDSCSDSCNQCGGESQGLVKTTAGIIEINGNVKAPSFSDINEPFREKGNVTNIRQCFKTMSTCLVDQSQCCKCQEGEGVLMNGECICNSCPDGTLNGSNKPGCSCVCNDGSTSTLLQDGTCNCNCICADGTISNLDQNGECSCGCTCKNCQHSVRDANGCHCPDDICPMICDVNEEVVWRNCECTCVAKHPCGIPPGCVPGRRGDNCDQPECGTCQGCSGNGFCTASQDSCSSSCQCGAQWRGPCCEFRIPSAEGGDPHLQTLDGVRYDFHGIGEFWDCKSEANDFGIQTRMFGYRNASLIGGAAIKAGENIVTVMTDQPADKNSLPIVRLNGEIVDTTNDKVDFKRNSGVHMVISKSNGEDGVMLVTVQYNTGVMVTAYVRYSAKMKRQYLNMVLQLTSAFTGKTSGLCGLMDDDPVNDFTGRNGVMYNTSSIIQFAESWRVDGPKQSNSGLQGSWSWTSSNFHHLDILGPSYTDTSLYSPVYDIREFSDHQMNASRDICSSRNIGDKKLLEECMFDVLVTEDSTFATQEYLKSDCPSQCSGRGECINSTCQCTSGWEGDACEIGMCPYDCIHGNCTLGFCSCISGWDGETCGEEANCDGVDNCTDENRGQCVKHNVCQCRLGLTGDNCNETAVCFNMNNCSDNGICVDHDVCMCDEGWTGDMCDRPSCEAFDYCNEHEQHGTCQGYDICSCNDVWGGTSCSQPDCSQVADCSGHGVCLSPNICRCDPGFYGESCENTINCPELDNCSGHGLCVDEGSRKTCVCDTGFTGSQCEEVDCTDLNNCSNHGLCNEPNICTCEEDYMGKDCSSFSCKWLLYCSGNGNCTDMNNCTCNDGWSGSVCDIADCSLRNNCSNNGFCEFPNLCTCSGNFDGVSCEMDIGQNINPPVFDATYYTGVVPEESPIGTSIYFESKLNASDGDIGRNAKLKYRFYEPNRLFSIDRDSGDIKTAVVIDRESLENDTIDFEVIVEDGASPPMSSKATVIIQIMDINDNSPTFDNPPNRPIHVKLFNSSQIEYVTTIHATDPDSGENGRVGYYISANTDQEARNLFTIHPSTGIIQVDPSAGKLSWKVYNVWVVATDNGSSITQRRNHLVEISLNGDFSIVYTKAPFMSDINECLNGQSCDACARDIVFALDTSCSIRMDDKSKVKDFVGEFGELFKIGQNADETQIAVVTYNDGAETQFFLNDSKTRAEYQVNAAKINLDPIGCLTKTYGALWKIRTVHFTETHGDRSEVPNTVVLIGDGVTAPNDNSWRTIKQAKLLKSERAEVFMIQIKLREKYKNRKKVKIAAKERKEIPSEPIEEHAFKMDLGDPVAVENLLSFARKQGSISRAGMSIQELDFDLHAYSPPLSLWALVKQHVPPYEQEEVKSMLGESLVEQSLELHEEVDTLLDIWRDFRDETTQEDSSSFLPEPPEMRDRLTQQIRFFVENIREKAKGQGRDPETALSKHNQDVIEYAIESSRPSSGSNSTRPGTACSILNGRMTPMRSSPPSDKVSANSTLSEEIDDMSEKLNMLEFDEVTQHLRETLEEEISQLLKDITFLQNCLDDESQFRLDKTITREPTLSELKEERSKLEKNMFADHAPLPSSPIRNKQPILTRQLPGVKPRSPTMRPSPPSSAGRSPLRASHSIHIDPNDLLSKQNNNHGAKLKRQFSGGDNAKIDQRQQRSQINNNPKLVKVGTINAPIDRSNMPMSVSYVTSPEHSNHTPSPPSSAKPDRTRPGSANKFRKMVVGHREPP
ncbi:unnamed protein product [Owenia fusiformis]|uniref:Uncharacterized protein n=1 Tax=Owenia fusiformis TaxID=6347 RepID=A0A8S4MZA7_OWEFU|nr:unnamed protein product [Owenia fusiformis]